MMFVLTMGTMILMGIIHWVATIIKSYLVIQQMNGEKIFGYYKSKGYSDAAAAAVCGNMFIESNYSTASDNGSHHGLCQWDSEHRYPALSKWAKENNMDPEDFKAQVEYSEKELTDTYLQNMGDWKNSTNVAEATTTYLNIFEGASGQATQDRINKAQIVMDAFSGKVSGALHYQVQRKVKYVIKSIHSIRAIGFIITRTKPLKLGIQNIQVTHGVLLAVLFRLQWLLVIILEMTNIIQTGLLKMVFQ